MEIYYWSEENNGQWIDINSTYKKVNVWDGEKWVDNKVSEDIKICIFNGEKFDSISNIY